MHLTIANMTTRQQTILKNRHRQPGDVQTWRPSENAACTALQLLLGPRYLVEAKPADLRDFYASNSGETPLGLEPEAKITDLRTGRYFYVEVKRQGRQGNAEERAYKHHTTVFVRRLAERTGLPYHAFVTVFCDDLAKLRRYTAKYSHHIEAGWYVCWADYDLRHLASFLDEWRLRLDPAAVPDLAATAVPRFERVRSDLAA